MTMFLRVFSPTVALGTAVNKKTTEVVEAVKRTQKHVDEELAKALKLQADAKKVCGGRWPEPPKARAGKL